MSCFLKSEHYENFHFIQQVDSRIMSIMMLLLFKKKLKGLFVFAFPIYLMRYCCSCSGRRHCFTIIVSNKYFCN